MMRMSTLHGKSARQRFDLVVNIMTAYGVRKGCVSVHGGDQWRPMLHVRDAAEAYVKVVINPKELVSSQIFNVGRDIENYTVLQIGKLVCAEIPGCELKVVPIFDDRNYKVNFGKIRELLGFKGQLTVSDAARELREAFEAGEFADFGNLKYKNIHQDLSHAPSYNKAEFLYSTQLFQTFVNRITGKAPEPQSAIALVTRLAQRLGDSDKPISILDVGCGLGHNYNSLKKRIKAPFSYTGIDTKKDIVDGMNKFFEDSKEADSRALTVDQYFPFPFEADQFDYVICGNFLHTIRAVEPLLSEMNRVCTKAIIIRTLVGEMMMRVESFGDAAESKAEIDAAGNAATAVSLTTVFSTSYIDTAVFRAMGSKRCVISPDNSYDEKAIKSDPTTTVKICDTDKGRLQYNDYLLLPYAFIEVDIQGGSTLSPRLKGMRGSGAGGEFKLN